MVMIVVDMIVVVKMAMVMMVKVNCHHCWHQQLGKGNAHWASDYKAANNFSAKWKLTGWRKVKTSESENWQKVKVSVL